MFPSVSGSSCLRAKSGYTEALKITDNSGTKECYVVSSVETTLAGKSSSIKGRFGFVFQQISVTSA
jgi:hypothetical protein